MTTKTKTGNPRIDEFCEDCDTCKNSIYVETTLIHTCRACWERFAKTSVMKDMEIVRLTARINDLTQGIVIRGWWCLHCDVFNGEEKEIFENCRHCGLVKNARARS